MLLLKKSMECNNIVMMVLICLLVIKVSMNHKKKYMIGGRWNSFHEDCISINDDVYRAYVIVIMNDGEHIECVKHIVKSN